MPLSAQQYGLDTDGLLTAAASVQLRQGVTPIPFLPPFSPADPVVIPIAVGQSVQSKKPENNTWTFISPIIDVEACIESWEK